MALEVSEFLPKLYSIENCYKLAYSKNIPNLEVGGQAPVTPTPPVVWVVLKHTDESGERLFEDSVYIFSICLSHRAHCGKAFSTFFVAPMQFYD